MFYIYGEMIGIREGIKSGLLKHCLYPQKRPWMDKNYVTNSLCLTSGSCLRGYLELWRVKFESKARVE